MLLIGFLGFLDLVWTQGQLLGPVGTGCWGLGLGLDNIWDEARFRQDRR